MCGINGIIDFTRRFDKSTRHELVQRMNDRIIYRGPDGEGIYDGDWFSFGMRRLAILDLENGDQPIFNPEGTVGVVFNGEIYNYRELKEELFRRGYSFLTNSDTEVIVRLFEEYGEDSFKRLSGMFAFSLYDRRREAIYLVRDRLGEKPLYWSRNEQGVVYGSELPSLRAVGLIGSEINKEALRLYFQYTYIPSPYTIYEGTEKLLPGWYAEIQRDGEIITRQYWDITKKSEYQSLSYEEAKEELRKRLRESVRLQMNCDVPYGAFLSGGIDSGIVAGLMAEQSELPIDTFTIGFEEKEYDESKNAAIMAKHLGTRHHEHILPYKEAIDVIDRIIESMGEPFGDSSAIPEYLVSKFASEKVKVVLTGDGGDELFLGYDKYLLDYYSKKYLKIPEVFRKGLIEPALTRLPDRSGISRKVNKVVQATGLRGFEKGQRLMQLGFKEVEESLLFTEEYRKENRKYTDHDITREYYDSSPGSQEMERTQYTDIKFVLEGDMLAKVDRMAMLNSLETRAPILGGGEMVDFAYNIPMEYKLNGKNKKKILKETFRDLFPKGYDKLPKSGFSVPLDHWFRNEMRERLEDTLAADRIGKEGIFHSDYIRQIIDEHLSGRVNRKSELWCLYVFQRWLEKKKDLKG